jgi:hypothetical protein
MPTVDTAAHRRAGLRFAGTADYVVDGRVEKPVHAILKLIADADAVLATGHLSATEVGWLVRRAHHAGVKRILLTHPCFVVPQMSSGAVRELVSLGAYAEVTAYQLLHQPHWDAARLAQFVREVGVERCVLSSDAGQLNSPPAPEALDTLIDALSHERMDRAALEAAGSEIPQTLVSPR